MHVGMLGTMSEMFLKDLKEKTKRGMLGNINAGKVPSGLAFGYDVAKEGDNVQGNRKINKVEAAVVVRIFEEYANGKSPRQIAKDLNADGIPGPKGRKWKDTTIRGQIYRGTGILNQFLYIGINCWNMCSYVKDPRTGKRVARPNPEELWETSEVPELRIISDDLWNKVKARQKSVFKKMERDENGNALNRVHRKRFLLSGLLKCSECGGNYSVISKDRYGCSNHKRGSSSCTNSITIKRQVLESRILSALKHNLIKPELVKAFVAEYTKAMKEKFAKANESQDLLQAQLKQIDSKIEGIMRAIEDGLYSPSMKARLEGLEEDKAKLQTELDLAEQNAPVYSLHPNIEELYARQVQRLEEALNSECVSTQAIELIQSMLDKIVLTPDETADNNLAIDLYGDLAQILSVCHAAEGQKDQLPDPIGTGSQITVVAGARFELTTFRL